MVEESSAEVKQKALSWDRPDFMFWLRHNLLCDLGQLFTISGP